MMAGQIRKGMYMVIKGRPCEVTDISTSKMGKHGHAKCLIKATDIFTGKQLEDMVPASHNAEVPFVERREYQVLGIDEDEREVHGLTDVGGTTTIKVLDGPLTVDDATLPSWEIWVRRLRPRPPSESPPTFTHTHASRPPCEQEKIKSLDKDGADFTVMVTSAMGETYVMVRLSRRVTTRPPPRSLSPTPSAPFPLQAAMVEGVLAELP